MITDPEYRQDPWRESIAQMLSLFEKVVVVYGRREDADLLVDVFGTEVKDGRLVCVYLDWPQPSWSYEELPRHLNAGLAKAREIGLDWVVKFDIDNAVHEVDSMALRNKIAEADRFGRWVAVLEKYQFFSPGLCYQKGRIPIVVNLKKPIAYGFDQGRYTDLCQPIEWDGTTTASVNGRDTDIPAGKSIGKDRTYDTGVHVWNYDYTWKTYDRAQELLYHFDRSHAMFWGKGYSGKALDEITPESAMADFLALAQGRFKKMILSKSVLAHPKHFIPGLRSLTGEQFGHGFWGKLSK